MSQASSLIDIQDTSIIIALATQVAGAILYKREAGAMKLSALVLAQRIAAAYSEPLAPETVGRLATALAKGVGIVREDFRFYAVLASPLDASFSGKPICVAGRLSEFKRQRRTRTTSDVAFFFCKSCKNLGGVRPKGYQQGFWAAAARTSFAPVPIGGDIGKKVGQTPDHSYRANSYLWFDLRHVPVGGVVYRLDSGGFLKIFQRLNKDRWAQASLRGAKNMVDLGAIMTALKAEHGPIDGLEKGKGCLQIPLLRQPPPST